MSGKSVFLLGPGFIGLSIISALLKEGYTITTLYRRDEARASLETLGVKTIKGALESSALIRQEAARADIIIHCASADHLGSALAVLDGIRDRADTGKYPPSIYIHTSGCSAITDASGGEYVSETVYDDSKPEMIDSIADTAPHRKIDLAILERRNALGSKAKVSIVFPPVIYGLGNENRLSIQIPTLVRFAVKHGYAGYAGKGKSVWGMVHVDDLARGYLKILHFMEASTPEKVMENPYWFAENGDEQSWGKIAEEIGKALYAVGKVEDPKAREIPKEEFGDVFGEWSVPVVGENARNRASRLRGLGWVCTEKLAFESLVEDELPVLLAEKEFKGYSAPVAS